MVAEERYPHKPAHAGDACAGRSARTTTNAFEAGSPGAYAPNGRQKC